MEYRTLGRTGLRVSVMGLGGGGHSKLGLSQSKSEDDMVEIITYALSAGVNLIDTAEAYGTEAVIGRVLAAGFADGTYLSTKYSLHRNGERRGTEQLEKSLDASLKNLGVEHVDIYHLHGVGATDYEFALEYLVPELYRMRDKGKIRFLGITEAFASDPSHQMLEQAVMDDVFDVMMVGFNILNQSARRVVLHKAMEKNIGVLDMFAVRRALRDPRTLASFLQNEVEDKTFDESLLSDEEPLSFLLGPGHAVNLPDAAYRFCKYEPGIHCVLFGTGNMAHLEANLESASRGPLRDEDVQMLRALFARVNNISGN